MTDRIVSHPSRSEEMKARDRQWEIDYDAALEKYNGDHGMAFMLCGLRPSDRVFLMHPPYDLTRWMATPHARNRTESHER